MVGVAIKTRGEESSTMKGNWLIPYMREKGGGPDRRWGGKKSEAGTALTVSSAGQGLVGKRLGGGGLGKEKKLKTK